MTNHQVSWLVPAAAVLTASFAFGQQGPQTAQSPAVPHATTMIVLGQQADKPTTIAGVDGELRVTPLVVSAFRPEARLGAQLDRMWQSEPALAGSTVHYQLIVSGKNGQPLLMPVAQHPQASPIGQAYAQIVDERFVAADERLMAQLETPEPAFDPSGYTVKPMPVLTEGPGAKPQPVGTELSVESYDVATGQVSNSGLLPARLGTTEESTDGAGGIAAGAGESELDLMLLENFNALSAINSESSSPWRRNVKIFMTFPSGNRFVGSGALIDPMHVLTAGHVIFDSGEGGWATSVRVVPAYDGAQSGLNREPFGDATARQLHSWSGWTSSRDFTHDLGVIDLNRPIGAITGYFGYGYNTSCGHFTTPTHHNAGYPGEAPYNGNQMFYRYGDFDSCPNGREARMNRWSWGGQSGSGVYKILSGSNRVNYSTISHRTRWWFFGWHERTDAIRLTSTKFGHVGSWLNADRPTRFDHTPLNVRAASSVNRGSRISGMNFLIHNYSRQNFSGRVNFQVRLSTNNFISTGDVLLGSYSVTTGINALNSTRVNFGSVGPRIPSTLARGNYFLGIILTTSDANGGNQRTLADDTVRIRVN